MKKHYLGIDGGGTKTAFLLKDEDGKDLCSFVRGPLIYRVIGIDGAVDLVREGLEEIERLTGIRKSDITATAIGIPCYGESRTGDEALRAAFGAFFGEQDHLITNDVVVGWAGSLGMRNGINVVAGTGSIAYGRNAAGEEARSGGWSDTFGDEGACSWLGRRTIEYFFKEADGRLPKAALFDRMLAHLGKADAVEAVDVLEGEYAGDRTKIASLQIVLLEAARAGDASALHLYDEAVEELFLIIRSCADMLKLTGTPFEVSYSGGLFHAAELVLPGLETKCASIGAKLVTPENIPAEGAVLLARSIGK